MVGLRGDDESDLEADREVLLGSTTEPIEVSDGAAGGAAGEGVAGGAAGDGTAAGDGAANGKRK